MLPHPKKQVEELKSKIKDLEAQLSNRPDAAHLKEKKAKIEDNIKHSQQLQGQLNTVKKEKQNLETAKQKAEEALETKTKELETQLKAAVDEKNKELEDEKKKAVDEKTALEKKLEDEKKKAVDEKTALEKELEAEKKKAKQELETAKEEAEQEKNKALEDAKRQAEQEKNKALETAKKEAEQKQKELEDKEEEIAQLKQQQPDAAQLQAKDEKIKDLEEQLSNQPDAAQLQSKINKQLAESKGLVDKLQKENKELEAKNKTTEQPKQGNGARYTATVGMGLAAGLIAFTALERTVRLDMLVMIGIAVASALVAGGITYAALPSTQVDGAKAQEVNENGKSK